MSGTEPRWVEVDLAGDDGRAWDAFQSRARGGTAFHRSAWLLAAAEATGSRLAARVLAEGNHWIGTFPVFESRRGFLRLWLSPIDGLAIPFLGPTLEALEDERPAIREGRWRDFAQEILRVVGAARPHYARFQLSPALDDVRPFTWAGWRASPRYTYRIGLAPDPERLLGSLQSEARRWIRKAGSRLAFREASSADGEWVAAELRRRYRAQGRDLRLRPDHVARLMRSLPPDTLRVFLVELNGAPVTGVLAVQDGEFLRYWIGSFRPDPPVPGANEYLAWKVILWARDHGARWFDFLGANTPQVVQFKRKFQPSLHPHYVVERASRLGSLALRAARPR